MEGADGNKRKVIVKGGRERKKGGRWRHGVVAEKGVGAVGARDEGRRWGWDRVEGAVASAL